MTRSKRQKLSKMGYRVTTTQEFLGLSDEEMALIELKLALIERLKELRTRRKITQQALADLMHSSQSRVAMLERGRPNVSLDLICRALFTLGWDQKELGRAITRAKAA